MSVRKVAAEDNLICETILNEMGVKNYDTAAVECLSQYLKSTSHKDLESIILMEFKQSSQLRYYAMLGLFRNMLVNWSVKSCFFTYHVLILLQRKLMMMILN